MQPFRQRGNNFKKHLQNELADYQQRNADAFNRLVSGYRLNPAQQHALNDIFTLSEKRGGYRELMDWLKITNDGSPPMLDDKRVLAGKLYESSEKVHQAEHTLYRQVSTPGLRLKVSYLKSDQEYLGAVGMHFHLLTHLRHQQTLNQLINYHFTTAMLLVDTRISALQARSYREHAAPTGQIYQEIAQLEDEKEVLQYNLQESRHEQKRLQDHINALKASSPYR